MIAEASNGVRVDRRRFVRMALRSAALGALAAAGGYLVWRSRPPGGCPRRWPCTQCGWLGRCAWSSAAMAPEKSGG